MRSDDERFSILASTLQTARKIAQCDPSLPAGQAAWEYLQFCIRHGCVGRPTDSFDRVQLGDYLQAGRNGGPASQEEAKRTMGIIICFSEEHLPCNPMRIIATEKTNAFCGAYVAPNDRLLVIGYADWYTSIELALKMLHEARHARHRFGGEFQNLPPLDPEEFHESRTWKYELDLLDACGGTTWKQAVNEELILLTDRYKQRNRNYGEKYFAATGKSYLALDTLFGSPKNPSGAGKRSILVSMRANFLLAENVNHPNLDQAYANIVGAYYEHCLKK